MEEAPLKIKIISLMFVVRGSIGAVLSISGQAGGSAFQEATLTAVITIASITAVLIFIGNAANHLKQWSWYAITALTSVFLLIDIIQLILGTSTYIRIGTDIFILAYLYPRKNQFLQKQTKSLL